MNIKKEHLINPPSEYRPAPFWSWNGKLETAESRRQVGEFAKSGAGGFFMHARGGLKTEYFSDEWFDNINASIDEALKSGINAWGYDENTWPSGFASGRVNGMGEEYQQKYLHMEYTHSTQNTSRTIANIVSENGLNMHFYYKVNPYYIDVLSPKVTDCFIENSYDIYKEKLGDNFKKLRGFFTDEPMMSKIKKSIPWSEVLPGEYEKEYGCKLCDVIGDLFVTTKKSYETRYRYYKLLTKLFAENFVKRVYDRCNDYGTELTGHFMMEDIFSEQVDANGSCMPGYMYFHMPGIDKLRRSVDRNHTIPQVVSVAAQTGRKRIMTESYALCGWDVTFEELKWMYEWQMVKGVNFLCQHLSPYSLKGMRKRDFPAGHFFQNPWWKDYNIFNDFAARMSMLLSESKDITNVLVLHNISSAWLCRCDDHDWHSEVDKKYGDKLSEVITTLDKNQILCHIGDEAVMEKLATIDKNVLTVGEMNYTTVIVPSALNMSKFNFELIGQFAKNGGTVIFAGEIPSFVDGVKTDSVKSLARKHCIINPDIISSVPESSRFVTLTNREGGECDIQYTKRCFDEYSMYYFVNSFSDKTKLRFFAPGKYVERFDYFSGECYECEYEMSGKEVCVDFELEKMGSAVFFVYDKKCETKHKSLCPSCLPLNDLLKGEWKITEKENNALVLDYCDVWFDNEKKHENIPVTDVLEYLMEYENGTELRLDYYAECESAPQKEMFLVAEDVDFYDIYINDEKIDKTVCGFFRDKAFEKIRIDGILKKGINKISLCCHYREQKKVYEKFRECTQMGMPKNLLYFEHEPEAVYILGDFDVVSRGSYTPAMNNSVTTDGGFVIVAPTNTVNTGNLTVQGYPFYTGKIVVEKTVTLKSDECQNRSIEFDKPGAVLSKIRVNGKYIKTLVCAPYSVDLSGYLSDGENRIEIELISNFRNLLGPLHLGYDPHEVMPISFHHKSKVQWNGTNPEWTDSYNFIEYGIFLK